MKCPAEITLQVIGGRWKIPILYHLFKGVKRFSELRHAIDGISQKVLTQQLREMERHGIIQRKVYPQVPPKVEYSLTSLGETLRPLIDELCQWGINYEKSEFENAFGVPPSSGQSSGSMKAELQTVSEE
jgi:DNA-binding HxlR family transcriptional regulator